MKNCLMYRYIGIMVLYGCILFTTIAFAQETEQKLTRGISIDKIVEDDFIQGRVYGLSTSEFNQYKVVVYVHTDIWYIHPYATGGKGKSYAEILSNGTWEIETVKREFSANKVAALIVKNDYNPPVKIKNINSITSIAIFISEKTEDKL